jgi:cytochrome P450
MPINTPSLALSTLPGPDGLPLLGNVLQLRLNKLHRILENWADQYGTMYQIRLGSRSVLVISDLDLIQEVLRARPEKYRRISSVESIAREMGMHGVFSAEGEQWLRYRQLTMPAFKPEQLRRFYPSLRLITERLYRRWLPMAVRAEGIDIDKDWMKYTVDVTSLFAFGYDINLLENEDNNFQRHLENQLPIFNRRALMPFPYWHYFHLPDERAMENSLVVIKSTIANFIHDTRGKLEQQSTASRQPVNFLEALLVEQMSAPAPLTDEEIEGNIITVLLAGEDTTAHALSWQLHLLSQHPEVQKKLQEEADCVISGTNIPPDFDSLEKLPYHEAVAQETLRLKSSAPMIILEPVIDVTLRDIFIPKRTQLMLLTRNVALQDEHFADAHEFKPERWLDTAQFCPHKRQASMPFGAGPRFCPGRYLALIEMKTATAMLSKNFSIASADPQKMVEEIFSFTMLPKELTITLLPRTQTKVKTF